MSDPTNRFNKRTGSFNSEVRDNFRPQNVRFSAKRISKYFMATMLFFCIVSFIAYPTAVFLSSCIGAGFVFGITALLVIFPFYFGMRLLRLQELMGLTEFAMIFVFLLTGIFLAWELIDKFTGVIDGFGLWAVSGLLAAIIFFFGNHCVAQLHVRRLGYG